MRPSFSVTQISQTLESYEKRPYPGTDKTAQIKKAWDRVPMEWIRALWKPTQKDLAPERAFVAGCGTGSEAFAMQRRFPKAQIVAVDFSPRSISIARNLQQRTRQMRNIRFHVANLARRNLGKITGGDFDFISCHGVLSYVPEPERVLANLRRQLKADGALYLGVNGATHFGVGGRLFLPEFGFDMAELRDGPYLRKLLKLWDGILDCRGSEKCARLSATYLASDLFCSIMHNLPLSHWVGMARNAGLHLQSNHCSWRGIRSAIEKDPSHLLIPRSRAQVCQLVEFLRPADFHRLLFTRQTMANPPWESAEALRICRPVLTNLYGMQLPKRAHSWETLTRVAFKSPAMNTRLDWKMTEWELEILRRSDGRRSIDMILERTPAAAPPDLLRQHLYDLHQLLVVTLMP